ncbi:gamma-crystallin M3-like [Phyllopteryx taeniolatus]|uniref:gamma-crystallin M3-like n=1 Tax=Phycodurus eques TaxID=693459 RepID=UPI002ACE71EB|nr:gamma-crystallin M3-like [Phycodurus eques]XP_061644847.1 gamma-crystallin M3-like [Phyllopteryx taeniolatus]
MPNLYICSYLTNTMTMGRIIFYEDRNFQGRSYETSSDCPELTTYLSRCNSCRVESGLFMVYEKPNFKGHQVLVRRGEYPDSQRLMGINMSDCIRSSRMIPLHRGQFRVRIYEKENFGGQMHELTDDCENVDRLRMSDCQSCNVMEGHWLMFEQPNFRGRMLYLKPGEHRNLREIGASNIIRLSSIRRIMDSC